MWHSCTLSPLEPALHQPAGLPQVVRVLELVEPKSHNLARLASLGLPAWAERTGTVRLALPCLPARCSTVAQPLVTMR